MDIAYLLGKLLQLGKGQIVSGDKANCLTAQQAFNQPFSANSPVLRIRTLKNLIEKKERRRAGRELHYIPDALDLSIKTGNTLLQ